MTATVQQKDIACSFCGIAAKDARKIVAGPKRVYICDECISTCMEVICGDGWPNVMRWGDLYAGVDAPLNAPHFRGETT